MGKCTAACLMKMRRSGTPNGWRYTGPIVTLDNIHKLLLDSLKTGVMLLDGDLHLRYINMEAEQLLAISDSKANNQFIGELLLDAEEGPVTLRPN